MHLCQVVGFFLVAGAALLAVAITFSHPDMTDMRLLLEFWPGYLVILAAAGVGMWIWER